MGGTSTDLAGTMMHGEIIPPTQDQLDVVLHQARDFASRRGLTPEETSDLISLLAPTS